jgi:hypothetical protein
VKKFIVGLFTTFEMAVWAALLITFAGLITDGFYWRGAAVLTVWYFVLPPVFVSLRRLIGLPSIPGERDNPIAKRAKELGMTYEEYSAIVRESMGDKE